MKQESFTQLLLRGAFSMMACDGEIHQSELNEIKKLARDLPYFFGLDYKVELATATKDFKSHGLKAIEEFVSSVKDASLTEKQELTLIEVLIRIIEADNEIKPSELNFLQSVKSVIELNDETLIAKFPTHFNFFFDLENFGTNISYKENLEKLDYNALDEFDI